MAGIEKSRSPRIWSLGTEAGKQLLTIWRCPACEHINPASLQLCTECGHPSPDVEEELASSGDEFLLQALSCLKIGDEEQAYDYFVRACQATPDSELAWYWRAKTALTLDEVIECLEQLLKLAPGDAKVQADLAWALQRRREEQAQPVPLQQPQKAQGARKRRIVGHLRRGLLQVAGVLAFGLGLALAIPHGLRLADAPVSPELMAYVTMLPSVGLPELLVETPYFPPFDLGSVIPLLVGLLLLHAAFVVVDGGGWRARAWTILLCVSAGGLMLFFGSDPPASSYAAGFTVAAAAAALVGGTQGDGSHEQPDL
ncbi:MAG: tetratricopeptide repeat protein [Chloroflexota bacterium]|jgi:hypothetical protein